MYVAQNGIVARPFQCTTEKPGIGQIAQSNTPISFKPEMDKIEILGNNGCSWSREVQREGIFHGAKVVQFEDKVLGEMGLVSPYDPPNANVGKAEFVSTKAGSL